MTNSYTQRSGETMKTTKNYFSLFIIACTLFCASYIPQATATDVTIVSAHRLWNARSQNSILIESIPTKKHSTLSIGQKEKLGEKACASYFNSRVPGYTFFHHYLRKGGDGCFCDTRVTGNNGIDFIGVPSDTSKPFLIVEAKYNIDGKLRFGKTSTKNDQMSREWCRKSLNHLLKILNAQKSYSKNNMIELATEAESEQKKRGETKYFNTLRTQFENQKGKLRCIQRSIDVIASLVKGSKKFLRCATVYNPTTGIIKFYTPATEEEQINRLFA